MYELSTKHIFISRDVVFHETQFSFMEMIHDSSIVPIFLYFIFLQAFEDSFVFESPHLVPTTNHGNPNIILTELMEAPTETSSNESQSSYSTVQNHHALSFLHDYHYHLLINKNQPQPLLPSHRPLSQQLSYDHLTKEHRGFTLYISKPC